jgi:glycerol-3-phosphate dehydrogenase
MVAQEGLDGQRFDVVIAGGGINGAGLARDLALRANLRGVNLRVLLLEKSFWGSGTSGRNSHLIHGGLRYLKYLDFGLVREALRERQRLLKLAPNTVRPLRFEMNLSSLADRLFYGAGVALYDALATGYRIGSSRYWGPTISYWDAASDSAALVIDNVRDARRCGAVCRPRTEVTSMSDSSVVLSGGERIEAGVVVDARGPWMKKPGLRLVRGSHIVVPRLYPSDHAIAHFHRDGRIIFFIPWGDFEPLTLVGTTEADHPGSADEVAISSQEREYLRGIARELFPKAELDEIRGEFSSLRPLVLDPGKSSSATSREHRIEFDDQGILRIEGGKYTTYRLMAEEAADKALSRVNPELVGFYPTRETPFAVDTQRPKDVAGRIAWAKREEGCSTAEEFLTCATNWAWQRRWTEDALRPIREAFAK